MRRLGYPAALPPLAWLSAWLFVGVSMWQQAPSDPSLVLNRPAAAPPAITQPVAGALTWELEAQGTLSQPDNAPTAHASNLVVLPHHPEFGLAVFWFAGSKEAQTDVRIAMSLWSRQTQSWTPPIWVLDRQRASDALGKGVLHIGNPVAWSDQQHRLHLFVVGTGLGGWAAARVLHLRQRSTDTLSPLTPPAFDAVGQLPLGWLWNLSHLVRHSPLPLADGGMVLPLHFELGNHYPVFAWFNADGEFQGMRRLTDTNAMQPAPVAASGSEWIAFLRTLAPGNRLQTVATQDAGAHWRLQAETPLSHRDSAVAALRLPHGEWLIARNPMERGRSVLVMHQSQDGVHWSDPVTLAEGQNGDEFSYPSLRWHDNRVWVTYTHLRHNIGWQRWRLVTPGKGNP